MSDNWYEQKAAGFWKASPSEVSLLPRKARTQNPRQDTKYYTEIVERRVDQIRGAGWTKWISPEAHRDDPGAKDQWVWKFDKKAKILEAMYVNGMSLEELSFVCNLHKGMGWRFPKLMVFDKQPGEEALGIMKAAKVPWCIEPEMRGDTSVEPPHGGELLEALELVRDNLDAAIEIAKAS